MALFFAITHMVTIKAKFLSDGLPKQKEGPTNHITIVRKSFGLLKTIFQIDKTVTGPVTP